MNQTLNPSSETPALKAGDSFSVYLNQAERDGWVLAVLGNEYLGAYTMPAGRVFLIVDEIKAVTPMRRPRSMALKSIPKKWIAAITAQGGRLTIDEALANLGYHDRSAEDQTYALAHRVPQWVKDLNT